MTEEASMTADELGVAAMWESYKGHDASARGVKDHSVCLEVGLASRDINLSRYRLRIDALYRATPAAKPVTKQGGIERAASTALWS